MHGENPPDVVIVGAGPSGLVLALALAHYKINSVVVEKNVEISADPRAIAMAGDTTRILELVGVQQAEMEKVSQRKTIGVVYTVSIHTKFSQVISSINFHDVTFSSSPFHTMDMKADWLGQILPPCIVLLQNGLERILREKIRNSEYANLQLGAEVTSIEELNGKVEVYIKSQDGQKQHVTCTFLVGADGKRGYVRKGYLEAKGIRQEVGVYPYEGTWIAANLHISLPTPESHPDLPLWKLGYIPDELWDIFWPAGFHFCRHPTMPIATGRFGPKNDRYWRFEYELPSNFSCDDPETHLREQLREHLILPGSRFSRNGLKIHDPVHFPEDCVRVERCAQAHFNNRVINRWFHNQIILIGDAAHVFPPFGAQGMASGIRDAFGLSWRLHALLRQDQTLSAEQIKQRQETMLHSWARERRRGVDDSSRRTEVNGSLMLGKSWFTAFALRSLNCVLHYAPSWRDSMMREQEKDSRGFVGVKGGFFLDEVKGLEGHKQGAFGGGGKTAQVYMKTCSRDSPPVLSDQFFWNGRASLTLLLLRQVSSQELSEIQEAIETLKLPAGVLDRSILMLCEEDDALSLKEDSAKRTTTLLSPSREGDVNGPNLLPHYDPGAFRKRFHPKALCALVRPDFIVFSQAQIQTELLQQLRLAAKTLTGYMHTMSSL